jgi:hypothetical protein
VPVRSRSIPTSGELVSADIKTQTARVLDNLAAVLDGGWKWPRSRA